jgi:hypothetical protein
LLSFKAELVYVNCASGRQRACAQERAIYFSVSVEVYTRNSKLPVNKTRLSTTPEFEEKLNTFAAGKRKKILCLFRHSVPVTKHVQICDNSHKRPQVENLSWEKIFTIAAAV